MEGFRKVIEIFGWDEFRWWIDEGKKMGNKVVFMVKGIDLKEKVVMIEFDGKKVKFYFEKSLGENVEIYYEKVKKFRYKYEGVLKVYEDMKRKLEEIEKFIEEE